LITALVPFLAAASARRNAFKGIVTFAEFETRRPELRRGTVKTEPADLFFLRLRLRMLSPICEPEITAGR
jgi:hypothetical protein